MRKVAVKYPQESCKRKKRPVRVILYPSNQSPGNYYELVSLSSEEVVNWLRNMSFPDRYIQIFKKREICGLDLVCMDDLTLQHYGLPNVYVIRLMSYINHLIYHFSEKNPGLSIPRVSDIFTCQNDEDDDTSWLFDGFIDAENVVWAPFFSCCHLCSNHCTIYFPSRLEKHTRMQVLSRNKPDHLLFDSRHYCYVRR